MTAMHQFVRRFDEIPELRTILDRAVALLWLAGRETPSEGLSAHEIAAALESAGYPTQND